MIRPLICYLFLGIIPLTPAQAMTRADAQTCVDDIINNSENGASVQTLIQQRLNYEVLIQTVATRSNKSLEEIRVELNSRIANRRSGPAADLDTVKPRGGQRPRGINFEYWGHYNDTSGTRHIFGVIFTPTCRIVDFADGNLWISFVLR